MEPFAALAALLLSDNCVLQFCLRLDDIVDYDPGTDWLVRTLAERDVGVDLAVIPARLTPKGATWVASLLATFDCVYVHQHGWAHVNHEVEGKRSEFGLTRPFSQRSHDVEAGAARLEKEFGSRFTRVFCPPWNRMAVDMPGLIRSLGFRGVSAFGAVPELPLGLLDVSAMIDWDQCMLNDCPASLPALNVTLSVAQEQRIVVVMAHPIRQNFQYYNDLVQYVDLMLAVGGRPSTFIGALEASR